MNKRRVSLTIIIAAVICFLAVPPIEAKAGNICSIYRNGEYSQTNARSMLNMINTFRTGSEAWYWNSDNITKTVKSNLAPLTYDYELEKAAMQRAMELSVIYSHTRPNNKSCFTTYPDSLAMGAMGENIAWGYDSAEEVFNAWKEDYESYSGQGHRRNMLEGCFTKVAISCFSIHGKKFWVQEFASGNSASAQTPANDGWVYEYAELDSSNVVGEELVVVDSNMIVSDKLVLETECSMYPSKIMMSVKTRIESQGKVSYGSFFCDEYEDRRIGDETVANGNSGELRGVMAGETTYSATSSLTGKTVTLPVEVVSHDINEAFMMKDFMTQYTGEPKTADDVYLSWNGMPMKEGVDYTVSYEDNINPGTGKMIVTGLGRFKGTTRIVPIEITANFSMCSISCDREFDYTGKPIVPKVKIYFNGKEKIELIEGTDFTVTAENNVEPGTGTVTIRGLGPYRSAMQSYSFKIREPEKSNNGGNGTVTGKKPLAKGSTFTYSFGTYKVTSSSAKNPTVTLVKVNTNPKSLKIPDKVYDGNKVAYKVTAIGANACKQKSRLTTLIVGKNVTSIGKNAFSDCGKLGKMTYQRANIKIGKNAYKRIKSKASVTVKSGTKAEKKAFVKSINKTGGAKNSKLK